MIGEGHGIKRLGDDIQSAKGLELCDFMRLNLGGHKDRWSVFQMG